MRKEQFRIRFLFSWILGKTNGCSITLATLWHEWGGQVSKTEPEKSSCPESTSSGGMTNVYESQGLCRNQTCRIAKMNKWCGKNERFWDSGYFHTSFRISLRGYNSAVYIKAKWHRRWALMMLSLGLNDAIIGAKRQRHWAPMTKPTLNNWKTILYKTYRNSSEKVWKNEANNVKIPCAENNVIS